MAVRFIILLGSVGELEVEGKKVLKSVDGGAKS